ncbi:DUF2291 family protein [Pararhizobium mangrovi]|uniref:DUF2291 domain-containing protein n=1 Tax=Pararhizobium mangrovi TaxID=2590452 RepID=A0A506TXX6_9HYPH|nr:DUF2291 domain-containing protein [Pararhizobium mangrovi]TPW26166.1 DUF2291 domain-containing protein [Pararhizobium mangrovi]
MSTISEAPRGRRRRFSVRTIVVALVVVVVIVAMALDTTVVRVGSKRDQSNAGFQAAAFGTENFPKIKDYIVKNAVQAPELAKAVLSDQQAAAKKYGVQGTIGAEIPVTFTGTVGEGKSGIYSVRVPNVPDEITIRVQTGPAVNGTDLRDATGNIAFGQFKNQIEYQNAGAALNNAMKQSVLANIDTANLTGKTISVTGVFNLINPKNWLVTPVEMSVQ